MTTDVRAGEPMILPRRSEQLNPRTPVVILSDSAAVTEKVRALADAMVLEGAGSIAREKAGLTDSDSQSFPSSARREVCCVQQLAPGIIWIARMGFANLLGYTRMELTSMTIDEASYRPQRTSGMFEQYVQNGKLEGQYILRHKSGKPIFIEYRSEIFPDGCMAAVWEPVRGLETAVSKRHAGVRPLEVEGSSRDSTARGGTPDAGTRGKHSGDSSRISAIAGCALRAQSIGAGHSSGIDFMRCARRTASPPNTRSTVPPLRGIDGP